MAGVTLLHGDVLRKLKTLPSEHVQTCITSPPYWGLRDYGVAGQLGLEATPESYVARMVEVFAEVRRVLRDDGTLWLNIGDSYANAAKEFGRNDADRKWKGLNGEVQRSERKRDASVPGLKAKDLIGIPWRLAFALQADGWYLRSDIIWHKPNPMPESVRDRPTKSHEYVFLLTKSPRYFFDAEAVREEQTGDTRGRVPCVAKKLLGTGRETGCSSHEQRMKGHHSHTEIPGGRNVRSVWTITPKPFKGAHFATFPAALVERCVKAGTSERGCCPHCGKPWERVTKRKFVGSYHDHKLDGMAYGLRQNGKGPSSDYTPPKTLGFRPACDCPAAKPVPCVVLDPFIGSGTTATVARSLGRDCVGIDLNPKYLEMARARIKAGQARVA